MGKATVCENCKFWIETGGTDGGLVGECRRNPPSPITSSGATDASVRMVSWPTTAQGQWCGDYEDRPMETSEVLELGFNQKTANSIFIFDLCILLKFGFGILVIGILILFVIC